MPNNSNGKWIPMEQNEVGQDVLAKLSSANPSELILGSDGFYYCIVPKNNGSDKDIDTSQQQPTANNQNGAFVETVDLTVDDDIIHMTPLIQPLTLVPYVSTSQPLYQYTPTPEQVTKMSAPKKSETEYSFNTKVYGQAKEEHAERQAQEQETETAHDSLDTQTQESQDENYINYNLATHPRDRVSFNQKAFGIEPKLTRKEKRKLKKNK